MAEEGSTPAPGGAGGGGGDENDWLFDYIMNVFKAPTWEVPIMTFVDDNCIVFDTDDENKFAYSELHEKFKELVEGLLESHLTEIGVAPEDFVEICSRARNARDVNKMVFDQILAVDDFLTFKKLMQKRNMELELEAVKALRGKVTAASKAAASKAKELGGEGAGEGEGGAGDTPAPAGGDGEGDEGEGEGAGEGEGEGEGGADWADDMDKILRDSLMEYEMGKTEGQLEMAELEQAIAASLALEAERLRLLKAVEAAERAAAAASDELDAIASAAESAAKEAAALSDALDAEREAGEVRDAAAEIDAAAVSSGGGGGGGGGGKTAEPEPKAAEPKAAAAPAAPASPEGKATEREPERTPVAAAPSGGSGGGGGSLLGELPTLGKKPLGAIGVGAGAASSPVPVIEDGVEERRRAAETVFERTTEEARKAKETEVKRMQDSITEAELRRRAEHLKRQRDMLRAKKQKEREAALAKHEAATKRGTVGASDEEKARVAAAARDAAARSRAAPAGWGSGGAASTAGAGSAAPESKSEDGPKKIAPSAADQKRMALRIALAQRMKEDVLAAEEARSTTKKETAFSALDEKLSLVEETRARNLEKKAAAEMALREAAAARARNVQASARGLM